MKLYRAEIIMLNEENEWEVATLNLNSGTTFSLKTFLKEFNSLKKSFDYSQDMLCFIPIDGGKHIYRKGDNLKKISKKEYYTKKLAVEILGV